MLGISFIGFGRVKPIFLLNNPKNLNVMENSKMKCEVIMLPTNGASSIYKATNNKLIKCSNVEVSHGAGGSNQHLYLVSNEPIKEGDWVLPNDKDAQWYKIWKYKPAPCPMPYWGSNTNCRKVIATTDTSLNIALINQQFVEKYVEKQGDIKFVNIEMVDNGCEEWSSPSDGSEGEPFWNEKWEIKTRSDNTVIIHKIKNSYSREELEQAVWKAYTKDMPKMSPNDISKIIIPAFEEWFETNF